MAVSMAGTVVEALLDGAVLASVVDSSYGVGNAALGSGWHPAAFDDFAVTPPVARGRAPAPPAPPSPPCTSPLNPLLETPCYTVVAQQGNFSVRDYATNVIMVTATSAPYNSCEWALVGCAAVHRALVRFSPLSSSPSTPLTSAGSENTQFATQDLLYYFLGENSKLTKVPRTVPLLYRPVPGAFGADQAVSASMAVPPSVYPSPSLAPAPTAFSKIETFPAARIAAVTFETAAAATDLDYVFACGELAEKMAENGFEPIAAGGAWAQAWATYSGRDASPHVNECWLGVQV
jgi:hypothetical protein